MTIGNEPTLIETIQRWIKYGKIIKKFLTKNSIPKKYDEIIAMKDLMIKEEKQNEEITEAIKTIKELQKKREERELAIRLARRAKIKRVLHLPDVKFSKKKKLGVSIITIGMMFLTGMLILNNYLSFIYGIAIIFFLMVLLSLINKVSIK